MINNNIIIIFLLLCIICGILYISLGKINVKCVKQEPYNNYNNYNNYRNENNIVNKNLNLYLTSPSSVKLASNNHINYKSSLYSALSDDKDICVPYKGFNICLNDIINAGKKAWELYSNNIGKIDIQNDFGTALPCVAVSNDDKKCTNTVKWESFENWQRKDIGPFKLKIISDWPYYTQLTMEFYISLIYGGNVIDDSSKSIYILKAQVIPTYFDPEFDNSCYISITAGEPFNISKTSSIIGCLELTMNIRVENPFFTTKYWTCQFFTDADGTSSKGVCSTLS